MSTRFPWILSLGATLAFGLGAASADDPPVPEAPPSPGYDKPAEPPPATPPSTSAPSTTEPSSSASLKTKDASRTTASANDDLMVRYDGKNLRFEQPKYGGEARVFVRDSKAGSETWTVHRGRDLDEIAQANAKLASDPEFATLRSEVKSSSAVAASSSDLVVRGAVRSSIESPNLVFEPAVAGSDARLFVRQGTTERVFVGSDLDSIVSAHPEVARIEGFQPFRARVVEWNPNLVSISPESSTIVDLHYAPEGVNLETWEFRDGRWVPQTYRGETIAMLRESEPALRDVLITSEEPMPTVRPTGRTEDLATPPALEHAPGGHLEGGAMPPPASRGPCPFSGAPLPAPNGAHQPGPSGAPAPMAQGILVSQVMAADAATAWELQPQDVIVSIDDRPVTTIASVREQFKVSGASRPRLAILRGGQKITLDAR